MNPRQFLLVAQQRTRLERRLSELRVPIPKPWPWIDGDPVIRNLQLVEAVEKAEADLRGKLKGVAA